MASDEGGEAAPGTKAVGTERVKVAAEGLKQILGVIAPEATADEKSSAPSISVVDEVYGVINSANITTIADQARSAVERYRNSMRWLVGAVAAIGILLFGSTAFTDGSAFESGRGWVGLVMASIGLVAILAAATLVFEPEDASLGELAADIKRAQDKLTRMTWFRPPQRRVLRRFKALFCPRLAATLRLADILERHEGTAHLGGHESVKDLIDSIGNCQLERRAAAMDLAAHRRRMTALTSRRELVITDLERLLKTRAELDKAKTVYGRSLETPIDSLVALAEQLRTEADRNLEALVAKQDQLDATDYQLGNDILHRALVLPESVVAQMRGTFHLSRRYLLAGGVVTLLGAMLYIGAVKEDKADIASDKRRTVRSGTLVVSAGTPTADDFKGRCIAPTILSVSYFGEDSPKVADEFPIVVSAPEECAGDYSIPGGRGDGDVVLNLNPAVVVPGDSSGMSS